MPILILRFVKMNSERNSRKGGFLLITFQKKIWSTPL